MIVIKNLVKEFRLYKKRSGFLKQVIGLAQPGRDFDLLRPLDNVELTVEKGEVHGIIGMNGAGKSTLLKILSGVLHPTSGSVSISGRVAALLELGTGFHGDLTGRENIYINGTMLGLTRQEIDKKLPEIQAFAELGDFFDRPVKIYSSGMYVRLAFSFAVSVEPDVLIIDEALSVGDAYFQQKCLKKIREFKNLGTTILFVSHDISAVRALCDKCTLLSKGKVIFTGTPMQALDLYNALLAEHSSQDLVAARTAAAKSSIAESTFVSGNLDMEVVSCLMLNEEGHETLAVPSGQKVSVQIKCIVHRDMIDNPTCGILFKDRLAYEIFGTNTHQLGIESGVLHKGNEITYTFDFAMNLGPGDYTLTVALHSDRSHVHDSYHWIERALLFKVLETPEFPFIGVARLEPVTSIHRPNY
ncbi:MAG: ABC transporter ATP-binding protein [Flavobacterium sp.]|nr:MAG: ABC transporter ATP-binding protein [Flavobacterium sp.]